MNSYSMGKVLKILRSSTTYKAKYVAEHLGISATYLSELENGKKKITLDLFEKVAEFYEIWPSQLMKMIETYEILDENEHVKKQTILFQFLSEKKSKTR